MFRGIVCHQCYLHFQDVKYRKADNGAEGLYWIDPKLSEFTDVRLDFCGPICSTAWYNGEVARKKSPQDDRDQTADQPPA